MYLVGRERLPEKGTVTGTTYRSQLKLAAEIKRNGVQRGKLYFKHGNARPHVAKVVKKKLDKLGWELLPHPPYSPDLALSNYHLFLSLSNNLRGRTFKEEMELKKYLQYFFDSKSPEFYAKGIYDLPRRWQEVIDSNGGI